MSAVTAVTDPGLSGAVTDDPGRPVRFSFVPALDGLRAIAVLGVMLYHGGAPLASGGFLGVNMFFVLSGFLITSLLLGEWAKRMTIRLGQFWARRARRLLPALLVMLIGVAIYAKVFATPGEFADLRLDSLSTLFYVANWHFIFGGGSYFDLDRPASPLAHMWSLSIEEQFYIVWPPVALLMLHLGRRLRPSRRLWPILATAVVGAIASAVDMRLSYQHGASVTRLYEGTDTRCQDILVGAALAIGMAMWAQHRRRCPATGPPQRRNRPPPAAVASPPSRPGRSPRRSPGWCCNCAGGRRWPLCLVVWSQVIGTSPFLFEGGYFLFALGVAAVILCVVTAQSGSLSRALGNPVFRYIGKISYGTYLWHLPLFALLDGSPAPPRRVPAAGRAHRRHPGGGHRLLLPGGGADPPGPDAVADRMEGVAGDQCGLSGGGGGHRGGHRARPRPRPPVRSLSRRAPSTADRRSASPCSAIRWPSPPAGPSPPTTPRIPTMCASTVKGRWGAG